MAMEVGRLLSADFPESLQRNPDSTCIHGGKFPLTGRDRRCRVTSDEELDSPACDFGEGDFPGRSKRLGPQVQLVGQLDLGSSHDSFRSDVDWGQ